MDLAEVQTGGRRARQLLEVNVSRKMTELLDKIYPETMSQTVRQVYKERAYDLGGGFEFTGEFRPVTFRVPSPNIETRVVECEPYLTVDGYPASSIYLARTNEPRLILRKVAVTRERLVFTEVEEGRAVKKGQWYMNFANNGLYMSGQDYEFAEIRKFYELLKEEV